MGESGEGRSKAVQAVKVDEGETASGSTSPDTPSATDSGASVAGLGTSELQNAAAAIKTEPEAKRSASERQFWKELAQVVDGDAYGVWRAVEKQMQQFHSLLRARAAKVARNEGLKAQHSQLQILLEQQMAAPINAELQLPTTRLATAAIARKQRC